MRAAARNFRTPLHTPYPFAACDNPPFRMSRTDGDKRTVGGREKHDDKSAPLGKMQSYSSDALPISFIATTRTTSKWS